MGVAMKYEKGEIVEENGRLCVRIAHSLLFMGNDSHYVDYRDELSLFAEYDDCSNLASREELKRKLDRAKALLYLLVASIKDMEWLLSKLDEAKAKKFGEEEP